MAKSKQNIQMKNLVKSAVSELVEENQDLIQQIIEEAVEQAFMSKAIKAGRKTKKISRNRILESRTLQERRMR